MTDKEIIRAEIESYIDTLERNSGLTGHFGDAQMGLCEKLLTFIDSMPEEPSSDDLEQEIEQYMSHNYYIDEKGVVCDINHPNLDFCEDKFKEVARHFANWQKNHIWTEESEKIIRKKLENDYSQANSMVIWASRSDEPFDKDTELIMVKESANTIIKLIKKEIGV